VRKHMSRGSMRERERGDISALTNGHPFWSSHETEGIKRNRGSGQRAEATVESRVDKLQSG